MKILKKEPYGFTCRGCKSLLEIEVNDVRVGYFGANWGGDTPERKYYVVCPVCGKECLLEGSIPPAASAAADQAERERHNR